MGCFSRGALWGGRSHHPNTGKWQDTRRRCRYRVTPQKFTRRGRWEDFEDDVDAEFDHWRLAAEAAGLEPHMSTEDQERRRRVAMKGPAQAAPGDRGNGGSWSRREAASPASMAPWPPNRHIGPEVGGGDGPPRAWRGGPPEALPRSPEPGRGCGRHRLCQPAGLPTERKRPKEEEKEDLPSYLELRPLLGRDFCSTRPYGGCAE